MTNMISWQKWFDPFGSDDMEEVAHDPYVAEYDDDTSHHNSEEDIEQSEFKQHNTERVKVIATPMGIIPVTDNTISIKIFNFWIGHTNFDITYKVANIIEKTEGVETLDIFTRYRFRIAVGKAFDDSSVMRDINRRVYAELDQ